MGNLQLLVAKLRPRCKSTKRALSPVPGRKNVENCHISQAFTCALPWSKLHKLTQMIRENLGPWPPGFFDASDSHGDRYNNHCPSRHGKLGFFVSRLIWETDNTIGCLWTNNDRSRTVCLSHVVDPGDKSMQVIETRNHVLTWGGSDLKMTLTYHTAYHRTSNLYHFFELYLVYLPTIWLSLVI